MFVSEQMTYTVPGPANQGGDSTGHGHDPGEQDSSKSMAASKLEAAHGFADNNVSLDSQHNQGPQGNLT